MKKTKPVYKKIRNQYFMDFCEIFKSLLRLNDTDIISNMCEASLDDSEKTKNIYLYDEKGNNLDAVKLDDMTKPFLHYMKNERKLECFKQPKVVDAICVNKKMNGFSLNSRIANL